MSAHPSICLCDECFRASGAGPAAFAVRDAMFEPVRAYADERRDSIRRGARRSPERFKP